MLAVVQDFFDGHDKLSGVFMQGMRVAAVVVTVWPPELWLPTTANTAGRVATVHSASVRRADETVHIHGQIHSQHPYRHDRPRAGKGPDLRTPMAYYQSLAEAA